MFSFFYSSLSSLSHFTYVQNNLGTGVYFIFAFPLRNDSFWHPCFIIFHVRQLIQFLLPSPPDSSWNAKRNHLIMKECVSKAHIKLSPHSAQTKLSTQGHITVLMWNRVFWLLECSGYFGACMLPGDCQIQHCWRADAQIHKEKTKQKQTYFRAVFDVDEAQLSLRVKQKSSSVLASVAVTVCSQGGINMIIKAVLTLKWCNIRSKNKKPQHKPLLGQIPNIFCLDLSSTSKLNRETSSGFFVFCQTCCKCYLVDPKKYTISLARYKTLVLKPQTSSVWVFFY